MKLALVFLGVFACSSAPILVSVPMATAPEAQSLHVSGGGHTLDGDWMGRGEQADGRSWPMRVHLQVSAQGIYGKVLYPDENCSGEWDLHLVETNYWEGDETILTDTRHKCIATGNVTLRVSEDGSLEWTWEGYSPQTSEQITARAVLQHDDNPPAIVKPQPEPIRRR